MVVLFHLVSILIISVFCICMFQNDLSFTLVIHNLVDLFYEFPPLAYDLFRLVLVMKLGLKTVVTYSE